jgi:hypothetical protein
MLFLCGLSMRIHENAFYSSPRLLPKKYFLKLLRGAKMFTYNIVIVQDLLTLPNFLKLIFSENIQELSFLSLIYFELLEGYNSKKAFQPIFKTPNTLL